MKKDRQVLEDYLSLILKENNLNKTISENIYNKFESKNFERSQIISIWNSQIPLETIGVPMLYLLTKFLYEETNNSIIDPDVYFTDIEKNEYDNFIFEDFQEVNYKNDILTFKNVLKVADDMWVSTISLKEIADMNSLGIVKYNPKTQRNAKLKSVFGDLITKINVKMQAVKQIQELIRGDLFIPNMLTFNVLETGEEEIQYNEKTGTIKIKGSVDIIDGFHRMLAILRVVEENPEIDRNMIIMITNFDEDKAQQYIVQENKRNPIDTGYIESISKEKFEVQVVNNLNQNSKSSLRGLITTDLVVLKNDKALVLFKTLSDSIKGSFVIKNQAEVKKVTNYLIDFFNELVGLYFEDFNNIKKSRKTSVVTYSSMFAGYILLAKKLYGKENWEELLKESLDKLDFNINNEVWEELKISENRMIRKNYNSIIKYFTEEVSK